jgi:L-cysteine S-thiosulfotransferase
MNYLKARRLMATFECKSKAKTLLLRRSEIKHIGCVTIPLRASQHAGFPRHRWTMYFYARVLIWMVPLGCWLSFAAPVLGQDATPHAAKPDITRGWAAVNQQRLGNCMACHSMPDAQGRKAGLQSTFAPPLDGVGSRYDTATLRQWVADARRINPDTLMPPFGSHGILSEAQIDDVVAVLLTLR